MLAESLDVVVRLLEAKPLESQVCRPRKDRCFERFEYILDEAIMCVHTGFFIIVSFCIWP